MGGDEFTVIIENLESSKFASNLAQKLIDRAKEPIIVDENSLCVTCSIGISIYPKDAQEDRTLLHSADSAMYKAKEAGKNRFHFFTEEI